ncbi:glycosyltransferase [Mycolicibacterium psychrotolerans]|uniref:glycosyltransferase n=1 Tax=Mycolicibacterium psychrotolerans TaxID=216929 RepID=UPI0013D85C3F|nr:glycosyltransferase [Mycolicibacterium psychrotolerans]
MRLAIVGDLPGRAPNARGAYDVASLAAALTRRGHDVRVLTGSRIDSGVADGGYRVVALPVDADGDGSAENLMPMIGEMGRFLIDDWTADPPDAVHCHGWAYGMAAQLAAKHRPVPIVQAFHQLATRQQPRGGAPSMHGTAVKLETLLARNATMVTTACGDAMHEVIRMGCPRAQVSVLPSGVDVDAYSADGETAARGAERHRIVALGQDFSADQGLHQVLAILPSLPAAELVVIGDGGADDDGIKHLRATADRLGVSGRVQVAATTDDREVASWLRSADVAVCPAPYDPDARTVLRAMACGAAVVATETGGPRDAVIAEVTGLLVPAGNPAALSRALRSILAQNVLRQGMGLAGRARARSRYSWDRVATDAEVVYDAAARRAGAISA